MKCAYCGAEVPAGKSFCMWCGTRQTEQEPAPVPEYADQTPVAEEIPAEQAFPEIPSFGQKPAFIPNPVATPDPFRYTPPSFQVPVGNGKDEKSTAEKELEAAREFPEIRPLTEMNIPIPAPKIAPAAPKNADRPRRVPPRLQLPTERGLAKMFFLGILTLGIYPIVIRSRIVTELNIAASRYDGKRTMPYFAMVTLSPITLGIYALVWMHKFCHRIGDELVRRNADYKFGPSTFWLWCVLGSLIIVGPFVFVHKLMKSMNKINAHYNIYG